MTMLQESVRVSQVLDALNEILANHKPQRLYHVSDDLGIAEVRTVETRSLDTADLRLANLQGTLTFIIDNTFNQSVDVQVFGSELPNERSSQRQHAIQTPVTVPTASSRSITVPLQDSAFPFMGVTIVPAGPPALGDVRAKALYQRWTE